MNTNKWINNMSTIKNAIDEMLVELENCKAAEEKARLEETLFEMDVLVRVL